MEIEGDIYQLAFERSNQGMVLCLGDRITTVNQAFADMVGYPTEALLSFPSFDEALRQLTHPDDYQSTTVWCRARRKGEEVPNKHECRFIRKSDEVGWWQMSVSPLEYQAVQVDLITYIDITEQRQTENQLRTLWRAIEYSPASIVITDRQAIIQYINPKFTMLTGYSFEEAVGQNPRILKTGFTPPEVHEQMWNTILSGQVWHGEFVNKKRNGELFVESAYISAVKDETDQITHFVAVKEDITERKLAEQELEESEERYRLLAENVSDVIWTLDLDGRLTYVSPSVETFLGYTSSEAMKLTLDQFFMPEHLILAEAVVQRYRDAVAFGKRFTETIRVELPYLRKDDSTVWAEIVSRALYDDDDNFVSIIGVTRDISERKRFEEERENLIDDLDAYAHTVAHDIKNPLSHIYGYAHLLHDDLPAFVNDDMKRAIQGIYNGSLKLSRIVDDLLLLASVRKLEEVHCEPINMGNVVQDALERLSPMLQEHGAQIILPEHGWPVAYSYAPWVEEIWVNFVSNAIKYGGKPPVIELGAMPHIDSIIRFWVKDNGQGIAQEKLALLFTQFTRLDQASIQGHGIGLSIVKRIINKLGGEAGVESDVGKGSTFYFTLPAHP